MNVKGELSDEFLLHDFADSDHAAGKVDSIYNSTNGTVFLLNRQDYSNLLSKREKEVLQLIDKGKLSKEISDTLFISIHTVNRHRQNILAKLRASNSVEACRIAKQMKLI